MDPAQQVPQQDKPRTDQIPPDNPSQSAPPATPQSTMPGNDPNQPVTPQAPVSGVPGQVSGTQAVPVKKSKKKAIIISIIIFILLLVGGGAAYAFAYLPNTPENVLLRALYNTTSRSEVKSGNIDGTLKVSGEGVPEQLGDINVKASLSESGDYSALISADLSGSELSLEARTIEQKDNYIKLDGLDKLGVIAKSFGQDDKETVAMLEALGPALARLNNKWIQLDESSGQVTGDAENTLDVLNLKQEDSDKVAEAYQKYPVIQIKEVLDDEDVNGEASYHYRVVLDKDNYVAFLGELKDANIESLKVEQADIDAAKNDDLSKLNLEVWIKKADRTINQVLLSGEEDGTKAELRLALTNVNQQINIDRPEDATKFEDIFSNLLGSGIAQ